MEKLSIYVVQGRSGINIKVTTDYEEAKEVRDSLSTEGKIEIWENGRLVMTE